MVWQQQTTEKYYAKRKHTFKGMRLSILHCFVESTCGAACTYITITIKPPMGSEMPNLIALATCILQYVMAEP